MDKIRKRIILPLVLMLIVCSAAFPAYAEPSEGDTVINEDGEENDSSTGGWMVTLSENCSVDMQKGKCVVDPQFKYTDNTTTYGRDVNLELTGDLSCPDLKITTDGIWLTSSNNRITVNVSSGNIGNNEDNRSLKITVDGQHWKNRGWINRIEEDCLRFNLEDGLSITKTTLTDNLENNIYYCWTITNSMAINRPDAETTVNIADTTVTYHTKVPYSGRINSIKNSKKNSSAISNTVGDITVSDNKTGKSYSVDAVKIVRLKSAKAQGPFPTVSNAGIQITKLRLDKGDKDGKKLQKELKKLTKADKNGSPESLAIPVIIYPRRITDTTVQSGIELKNKNGIITLKGDFGTGKKETIKSGGKDSFKTGTYLIEMTETEYTDSNGKKETREAVKIDSADFWTGSGGYTKFKKK